MCSEILQRNDSAGTPTNFLANIAMSGYYYRIVFARGGTTFQGYYVRGSYQEGYTEGKSIGSMSFSCIIAVDGSNLFTIS